MSIDIVHIIKEIKNSVFLAESMGNKYILKVTKKDATNKMLLRHELEFIKFAHTHPQSFQRLIDYKITSNKIKRLYNYIEGTLASLHNLPKKTWSSILAQLVAILILINEAKFAVCNLYDQNSVGYVFDKQKVITIGEHTIPLYGYRVMLLNHDNIYSKSCKMSSSITKLYY